MSLIAPCHLCLAGVRSHPRPLFPKLRGDCTLVTMIKHYLKEHSRATPADLCPSTAKCPACDGSGNTCECDASPFRAAGLADEIAHRIQVMGVVEPFSKTLFTKVTELLIAHEHRAGPVLPLETRAQTPEPAGRKRPAVIDLSDSDDDDSDMGTASEGNVKLDDEDPEGEVEDFLFSNALDEIKFNPVFVAYAAARTDQDKEHAEKVWGVPVAAPRRQGPGSRRGSRAAPGHAIQIIDSDDEERNNDEDSDGLANGDRVLIPGKKRRGRNKAIPSRAATSMRASRRRAVPAVPAEPSYTDCESSSDHLDLDEIDDFRAMQEEYGVITLEDPTAVYDPQLRSCTFTNTIARLSERPFWFTRIPPPLHRQRLRADTEWHVPHAQPPRMDVPITFARELASIATYAERAGMQIAKTHADVPLLGEYDRARPETPKPFTKADRTVPRSWAHARYWLTASPDVRNPDMARTVCRKGPNVWPSKMPPQVPDERTVASDLEQVRFWAEQVFEMVDMIPEAAGMRVRWGEEEPGLVVEVENGGDNVEEVATTVKVVNELVAWCFWLRELGAKASTLVAEERRCTPVVEEPREPVVEEPREPVVEEEEEANGEVIYISSDEDDAILEELGGSFDYGTDDDEGADD
ncbi:hypothetical protein AMAG_13486 [Allomyces macrogynus ATCC 38327]|uniref:Uncharacterized protein n=1 Tax=Allomyces macrogynus (strain ATCC 38327) TaxID=578462 RepID=A0A0L0T277_ALLM3|nr:hypothetical protein AMAG_13486 [Allomyces macrogynus ATCC 38327]|eukprot:KNE68846.1 hypothetical protein AMAG_13486 [Allomyces macrogynus ATCC 38327]